MTKNEKPMTYKESLDMVNREKPQMSAFGKNLCRKQNAYKKDI